MNLLEIVQAVSLELGLGAPVSVVNTSDMQVLQMVALANREGKTLARDYDWNDLQTEFIVNLAAPVAKTGDIFTGSNLINNIDASGLSEGFAVSGIGMPQAQRVGKIVSGTSLTLEMLPTASASSSPLIFAQDTYNLPPDFDRYIGQTWWDRTNRWRLIGPDSPQTDQLVRSGVFTTGPRRRWRQTGGKWRIWPAPFGDSPGALVFDYVSKNWCMKEDGTTTDVMVSDADQPLLDAQLLVLGVKWRVWQAKGFEYAAMQQEYVDAVRTKFAGDGGVPDLYLNRRAGPALISNANLPDGNWPG